VAFGAEHGEATEVDDLVVLVGDLPGLLLDGGLAGLVPFLWRGLVGVHAGGAEGLLGQVLDVAAEHDVHAAAGHVGGDGDGAEPAGLGDDVRLAFVVLGVEDRVLDAALVQQPRDPLGLLDGDGADQDRLALAVAVGDLVDQRVELGRLGLVDDVAVVGAAHRLVGGDLDDAELVDVVELGSLGLGGAGHAGELAVHAEVVLQGDGGVGLVLLFDPHAFLGLDRLVEALGVAAALQHPAGELVHDQHLAVADDVLVVALVELLGADGVLEVVDQRGVEGLVEVVQAQQALHLGDAGLGDRHGLLALVDLVVDVAPQAGGEAGELLVPAGALLGGPGDDQRGAGLVDQDGVDLVHDGVGVAALHQLLGGQGHVVAQVVEAELVVGAVGDVGAVGRPPLPRGHGRQDDPDVQAEEPVDDAHPLGVAAGQVVVDGDDVDALAGEGVEVAGQGGDQGLALAGLHLGDVAPVERDAADQLHVEVALAEGADAGLADGRERLGEQLVQVLAVVQALAEHVGELAQLGVAAGLHLRLQRVDRTHHRLAATAVLALTEAEDLGQYHGLDASLGPAGSAAGVVSQTIKPF
jgi:hypothetical protein